MGMFDEVKFEYPFPDAELQSVFFQTKDLDCCMDLYIITKEGRLIFRKYEQFTVPEDDRPFCKGKKPEDRTDLDKFMGCLGKRNPKDIDQNFHGVLSIIGRTGKHKFKSYLVKFTDGKLISITKSKPNN